MEMYRIEGLILDARVFQDYDAILTVYTADKGILKFIVKGAFRQTRRKNNFVTTPLTRAEFMYTVGRGDLHKCSEISVMRHSTYLRKSLAALEASCDMSKAISASQWPDIPAPDLYGLFNSYLEKIPQMQDPFVLASSFRLKILRHDGILQLGSKCTICSVVLNQFFMASGECVCSTHASNRDLVFSLDEISLVHFLANCRTFSELEQMMLSDSMRKKVMSLFDECMK
jgi:DNA repair protein RecO (recombination protein O)